LFDFFPHSGFDVDPYPLIIKVEEEGEVEDGEGTDSPASPLQSPDSSGSPTENIPNTETYNEPTAVST